jgi:hypothetical protein
MNTLFRKGDYVWIEDNIWTITDIVSAHPHQGDYFYEAVCADNGDCECFLEHEITRRALELELDYLRDRLFSQPC